VRIALAADFYPPFTGGVELQVQALARQLSENGHDVTVMTIHHPGMESTEVDGKIVVHRLEGLLTRIPVPGAGTRRYHPPLPDPLLAVRIRRLVRTLGIDLVQAHGWMAYSVAAGLVGTRTRMLLSVRDYGYSCAVRTLLQNGRNLCEGPGVAKCLSCAARHYGPVKGSVAVAGVLGGRSFLRRRSAAVHAVSRYVADISRRDFIGPQAGPNVTVIPDIVISEAGTAPAEDPKAADGLPSEPFILFVGALQPHKGIYRLLEAYQRLTEPPPLVLIGTTWPDSPRVYPAGVTVRTDLPHTLVMEAWRRALFGVVPSRWPDPLPGVVREAMLSGRTVVASRVGGIVDMVRHEENGLLVPPDDPVALADGMQRLIDDPELRQRLGDAARSDALAITTLSITAEFEALYRRVADGPRRRFADMIGARPQRILVIGGSGQGKSTFARAVAARLRLEAVALDDLVADHGLDTSKIEALATRQAWVAEGIHTIGIVPLLRAADLIVWLDETSVGAAIARVLSRFVRGGVSESQRRTGAAKIFRLRSYVRHTAELARAIPEIAAYYRSATADAPTETRAATADVLRPYRAKLLHCRRRGDAAWILRSVDRWRPNESRPLGSTPSS
jgi:glycosyltransferase involved in cell wall biosynthesis